ncbi:MAG: hypothetical protein HC803_06315 [Saprospiraceae bacterium]|nr:hypothetical protein [Saprospiraceae bacterium]
MEISLTGICPYLYLFQENGLHEWEISNTLKIRCSIFVVEGVPALLHKSLHTKNYWTAMKERRIYKYEHLWDAPFEINREIPKNKFLDYLLPVLNKRFEQKLDEVLL